MRCVLNTKRVDSPYPTSQPPECGLQALEEAKFLATLHLYYIKDATGERCVGHPAAPMVLQSVNGFRYTTICAR